MQCIECNPFTSSLAWNFVEPISRRIAPGSRVHDYCRKRGGVGAFASVAAVNCVGDDRNTLCPKLREAVFRLVGGRKLLAWLLRTHCVLLDVVAAKARTGKHESITAFMGNLDCVNGIATTRSRYARCGKFRGPFIPAGFALRNYFISLWYGDVGASGVSDRLALVHDSFTIHYFLLDYVSVAIAGIETRRGHSGFAACS
jgi:hypothetical protein